jgi:hypothetical protein
MLLAMLLASWAPLDASYHKIRLKHFNTVGVANLPRPARCSGCSLRIARCRKRNKHHRMRTLLPWDRNAHDDIESVLAGWGGGGQRTEIKITEGGGKGEGWGMHGKAGFVTG